MTKALEGKVALVTGGARGIGAAIVRRLADDGAHVAFTYSKSGEQARVLETELRAWGADVLAVEADSGDVEAVGNAVTAVRDHLGKIDILVNNAGVSISGVFGEIPTDDFEREFAINVRGVFVALQEASRYMGEGSRIINIGSVIAERAGFPGYSVYAMTKAAVVALTKGVARDLGKRGITVNTIQPGPVIISMTEGLEDLVKPYVAVDRLGKGAEIASMVAYLAQPESSFITGAALTVDGGFLA
ncbi:3-oxoacyl-ACP reductase family protein [Rhizobium gallicum]|uniref:3-oxoacyl-ACP reductase family protein n=1 Tax=Rhizobium gallicum TaxID=56730 RepID=UPI001EF85F9D|nr:3-oxoacyl-ACP reductase family protein [Rhizobium gallicum]ULJ75813.1 3-oxoacyl-ACP reductase FabG [Rhizobium gallicum]